MSKRFRIIPDSFTCPCPGCTTQERYVPAMRFERDYQAEAAMRAKYTARYGSRVQVSEIYVCQTGGFKYVIATAQGELWTATYINLKTGKPSGVFLGDRHHASMPALPSFDSRHEAERACEVQHKSNRQPN